MGQSETQRQIEEKREQDRQALEQAIADKAAAEKQRNEREWLH